MRVLIFGASLTQGFWDTKGGWVQRLRAHYDTLQVSDFNRQQPTVFNLGVSGDTTIDVLERLEVETKARYPESKELAFIFSIGTNNAVVEDNGKEWSTPEDYRNELAEIVAKAHSFSDKIMFVGLSPCEEDKTTPVLWANINYTNERIMTFEKEMRDFCGQQNIPQVEVFEAIREKSKSGQTLFADGLHLNDDGHELIFQLVLPELDMLLG